MNKIISYILVLFVIVILSGCGLREKLLSPPDVFKLPEGSLVALCTKDDNTYKFIYKDDGVYIIYPKGNDHPKEAYCSFKNDKIWTVSPVLI